MFDDPAAFFLTLIPLCSLVAAVLTWALAKRLGDHVHWVSVIGGSLALAASIILLATFAFEVSYHEHVGEKEAEVGIERTVPLWTWIHIEDALTDSPLKASSRYMNEAGTERIESTHSLDIGVTLRLDSLTVSLLVIVNLVGLLVILYSIGYMHDDPGYARYFAYVSLFVFSMSMLVAASNFLLLYIFWEGVGVCSYFLIGFWFKRDVAVAAAKKAFLINRIGDACLLVAIFMIWIYFGSLNFHDTVSADGQVIPGVLGQTVLSSTKAHLGIEEAIITGIAILLLLGACGKSAQFPLHTWLPDAMEGPTPASALIHAATMVTAGVYLVARCFPMFAVSQGASQTVLVIGLFTALISAVIAITQYDLKRVLAYSTISQLGFMFIGLGTQLFAGAAAAIFHLITHAFFKALLFLGAGSVMHAMGNVIDMRRFGELRKYLPYTFVAFLIGALALAGIPPLGGFFSKDEILFSVYARSNVAAMGGTIYDNGRWIVDWYYIAFLGAVLGTFLTAIYTARAVILTFFGEEKLPPEAGDHPHEASPVMMIPMAVLAIGTILVGFFGHAIFEFLATTPSFAWGENYLERYPQMLRPVAERTGHTAAIAWSLSAGLLGIGIVCFLYFQDRKELEYLGKLKEIASLRRLSENRFYIDECYTVAVVWPLKAISWIFSALDRYLLDGLVSLVGRIPGRLSYSLRWLGTGMVQYYALAMVIGILLLMFASGILEYPQD